MTVEYPEGFVEYIANGTATYYQIPFAQIDDSEIVVTLNGSGTSAYTQQDLGIDFFTAPVLGTLIRIQRISAVTQPINFESFDQFKAQQTEDGVDRLIALKQESVYRSDLDLTVVPDADSVLIENSRGVDADVLLWTDTAAGVFAGEATKTPPAAGASRPDKPPRFAWFQWDDNVPAPYTPNSNTVSLTGGWAASQSNFYSGADKVNPFDGLDLDEFTMSCICRSTAYPSSTQNYGLFNLQNRAGGISMYIRRRPVSGQIYWGFHIVNKDNDTVAQGTIEFTIDYAGDWGVNGYLDWMWLCVSYSQTDNTVHFRARNITQSKEAEAFNAVVINNVNVDWVANSDTTSGSICVWNSQSAGSGDIGANYWHGQTSQTFIHSVYSDLSALENRDKFCKLDGVLPIITGSEILGTQPLVYLPTGIADSNTGSLDLTSYPASYYLTGTDLLNEVLPPVSSNP